jgi:hypothetical protein
MENNINNLKKCPSFEKCSQNFCPLDLELNLRTGKKQDMCRWMREPKKKKINGREFVSGGGVMPDVPLNFVPQNNLKRINKISQKRWLELKSQ